MTGTRRRNRKRACRLGTKGTPETVPMSYERRLASYGLRDLETGKMTGKAQSPAQRRRIRSKLGHAQRLALIETIVHDLAGKEL